MLFDEETTVFNNHDQKGGNFGQHLYLSEKVIELYESQLKEKEATIALFEGEVRGKQVKTEMLILETYL